MSSVNEETEQVWQGLSCAASKFLLAGAGQRMFNNYKWIATRAMRVRNRLSIRDKGAGAYRDGWDSPALKQDPVQHTAGIRGFF